MATITSRKTASGEMRHRVTIRLKKDGAIVHQESKTFANKATAKEWARRREAELDDPAVLAIQQHKGNKLSSLMASMLEDTADKFGRTRNTTITFLMGQPIADLDVLDITARMVIDHAQQRRAGGAGGATVLQDVLHLRAVLRYAKTAKGLPVSVSVVDEAEEYLLDNRIIHKPNRRDRRPTYEELSALDEYFARREAREREGWPSRLIMWFAIYSCRRQEEICQLLRSDIDWENKVYVVRDMKHSKGSKGNHKTCRMPENGWKILKMVCEMVPAPDDGRVLPVTSSALSASFTNACKVLGIDDLCFHDLRHEGASRLGEDGYTIPQLQQVTAHDSWSSLSRYVNICGVQGQRLDFDFVKYAYSPSDTRKVRYRAGWKRG